MPKAMESKGRWAAGALGAMGLGLVVLTSGPATASAEPLVKYQIVHEGIPKPLTDVKGDAAEGFKIMTNKKLGNCVACHRVPLKAAFQGTIGPNLAGVAERLTVPQMRLRVVNPKNINPETIMPAFYRVDGLVQVPKKFQGKPILSAQQVEDVIAALQTFK